MPRFMVRYVVQAFFEVKMLKRIAYSCQVAAPFGARRRKRSFRKQCMSCRAGVGAGATQNCPSPAPVDAAFLPSSLGLVLAASTAKGTLNYCKAVMLLRAPKATSRSHHATTRPPHHSPSSQGRIRDFHWGGAAGPWGAGLA